VRSERTTNVAVIGAAGFVGRELLRRLEELGIRATAVIRGRPEISVDGEFHVACSDPADLADRGFDVVLNLAYPSGGKRHEHPELNAGIADTVGALIRDGGRLIQVSTLAVFGSALDRPIKVGPVPRVRDVTYVESKIAAEHQFVALQSERRLSLDIVRLGNVWGYASGTWALPLVQRLLTGRPVGVAGMFGYSNTTDVANVADYLASLIRDGSVEQDVRYHHLAEFSGVKWGEWVDSLADALDVQPTYASPSALTSPMSGLREAADVLGPMRPRRIYRQLADGRVTGSWSRTLVRQLPPPIRLRLQSDPKVFATEPEYEATERDFLTIMAAQEEFRSVVSLDWTPPLNSEQSMERVLRWLGRG
jgi:nucleoside-diphosphate-sugar epimerase